MRRAIILGLAAMFLCGVAVATDYHWSAGKVTLPYTNTAAWTPTGAPSGAADAMYLDNGSYPVAGTVTVLKSTGGTATFGKIQIDNGVFDTQGSTGTIRVSSAGGQSGDFIVQKNGQWSNYGSSDTLDVDGNVYFQYGVYVGWTSYSPQYSNLVMRGVGKTLDMTQAAADQSWTSVTIYDCASVSALHNPWMHKLTINGTITGGNWTVLPTDNGIGKGAVIQLGPNGAMSGGTLIIGNVNPSTSTDTNYFKPISMQYVDLGGGTYPAIKVQHDASYYSNQVIRMKGNVSVTSDMTFFKSSLAYYSSSLGALLDADNGSGKVSNLTVGGNLDMDGVALANNLQWAGIRGRTATVNVNGSATFGRSAYLVGDSSNWNFGKNVTFTTNYHYENSTLTGTTFNIVGTGAQTLDFGQSIPAGKSLPLGNLVINKLHGVAALADNVLLTGNFRLQSGGLSNTGNYWINMQGGKGTWAGAETFENDNSLVNIRRLYVKQGSPTWVKLNSNLTITDNLDVDPNCILFTNGFTLSVTGGLDQGTYGPSSLAYTTREGGLILVSGVPEPATLALLGTGGLGLIAFLRRRRIN